MKSVVLGHMLQEIPQIPVEMVSAQVQPKPPNKEAEQHGPAIHGRWQAFRAHCRCSCGRYRQ